MSKKKEELEKKGELKYCPKCKTNSISILKNQELVECQNLNCCSLFRKKDYLEFLEFWEKLDHSLDEQFDRLKEDGEKMGFDSPDTSELFHLDAVGYSFDSEYELYRAKYSLRILRDTEGEMPEDWTEKKEKKNKEV